MKKNNPSPKSPRILAYLSFFQPAGIPQFYLGNHNNNTHKKEDNTESRPRNHITTHKGRGQHRITPAHGRFDREWLGDNVLRVEWSGYQKRKSGEEMGERERGGNG